MQYLSRIVDKTDVAYIDKDGNKFVEQEVPTALVRQLHDHLKERGYHSFRYRKVES